MIRPARAGRRPEMARSVVVLPAPLPPSSVGMPPSATFMRMPLTAPRWPEAMLTSTRSRSAMRLLLFRGVPVVLIIATQVRFDAPLVALHLGRAALTDLAAVVQHGDVIGDLHDQAHVVLDEQHGDALVADVPHHFHQLLALVPVHAVRGLIELH